MLKFKYEKRKIKDYLGSFEAIQFLKEIFLKKKIH